MSTLDLVVQGDSVATHVVQKIAGLVQSVQVVEHALPRHRVYRFAKAIPPPPESETDLDLDILADLEMFDYAWVPSRRKLSDYRLLAMDMDSTLINIECINEIADFAGIKDQVADITRRAMQGELDWPQSLRERVALLAGLDQSVLEEIYRNRLKLSPGAEDLLRAARARGIHTMLVSGGFTFFTDKLKQRLDFDYAFSNTLEIVDGKLTGKVVGPLCDAEGKAASVRETAQFLGFGHEQIMVMGDGANDLRMMAGAGTSIAWHARPIVRQQASHAINFVGLDGVLGLFPAD
ncbi:MAG: phosphoserine phosphatase SerB [Betaproteobacteria bacterium]|nr:phosphoserine phosphatase SerB [Betaproteobacteria bacterium]